jgi:hypothetical protein
MQGEILDMAISNFSKEQVRFDKGQRKVKKAPRKKAPREHFGSLGGFMGSSGDAPTFALYIPEG